MQFLIPFTRVDKPSRPEYQTYPMEQVAEPATIISLSADEESQDGSNSAGVYDTEIYFADGSISDAQDEEDVGDPIHNDGSAKYQSDEEDVKKGSEIHDLERTAAPEGKRMKLEAVTTVAQDVSPKMTSTPATDTNSIRTPVTKDNLEETPEWSFFRSLMPDILTMTAAQKRKMRMQFIGVIDDILSAE